MWIKSGARLKLARNCSQLIDVGSNCAGANASASPSALARAAAPTRCPVRTRKSLRYTTPPRTRVVILQPGRSLVREGGIACNGGRASSPVYRVGHSGTPLGKRANAHRPAANRSQHRQEFAHPLQSAVQFRDRRRVGNADVVAGTETFSRNGGHVGLAQEFPSQIGGRFHPTASKECRDIWICVERPFRQRAFNSGNGTQAFYNMIAQPNVLLAHFFDALLRTVQ